MHTGVCRTADSLSLDRVQAATPAGNVRPITGRVGPQKGHSALGVAAQSEDNGTWVAGSARRVRFGRAGSWVAGPNSTGPAD